MMRLLLTSVLLISLGCGPPPRALVEALPERVGQEWRRTEMSTIVPEIAPDRVRELGLDEAVHVIYAGPGSVGVRVFRMRAGASAFELIQQWRQDQGLATYADKYFLVADTEAQPEHARAVLQALQSALKQ